MAIFTRWRINAKVIGIVKRYSPACDKNKQAILAAVQPFFVRQENKEKNRLLEIGSGTGQHAVFLAEHLPLIKWQPSDKPDQLASIDAWQKEVDFENLLPPIALNIDANNWPIETADYVFTANTAHIISTDQLQKLFKGVAKLLAKSGIFFIYGPFNYGGKFTSNSNAEFDKWLKERDSLSGIRDFEMLNLLANHDSHFCLTADISMPANNRLLVFEKN